MRRNPQHLPGPQVPVARQPVGVGNQVPKVRIPIRTLGDRLQRVARGHRIGARTAGRVVPVDRLVPETELAVGLEKSPQLGEHRAVVAVVCGGPVAPQHLPVDDQLPLYEKFANRLAGQTPDGIAGDLRTLAILATPTSVSRVVPTDPDDDEVLAAALAGAAGLIASGGRRDLLPLDSNEGIPIVTARDAWQRIASKA